MAVLAARVRDAHAARVWTPLGQPSWEAYCDTEFGISRAQAYRLLDVARALTAIHDAVAAGTETSRTRDTGPATAAALDYGLSQRALLAVSSRAEDVAELITRRLAMLEPFQRPLGRVMCGLPLTGVSASAVARRSQYYVTDYVTRSVGVLKKLRMSALGGPAGADRDRGLNPHAPRCASAIARAAAMMLSCGFTCGQLGSTEPSVISTPCTPRSRPSGSAGKRCALPPAATVPVGW